ncbi:MAG TPA: ROK family protein [Acidobacteriota bacterium]|nr:ROK family protein [Acidobacteriota bacterium]
MKTNNSLLSRVLGVDIGGSGTRAAPVDVRTGTLSAAPYRVPLTESSTPETVMATISETLAHFGWSGPLGCGYPGVVRDGVANSAANVSSAWLNVNVRQKLTALTGGPVVVINDADAAGLAEMHFGAGRTRNHAAGGTVLMITLGTGIGSAFFHNGRLFPNTEFGHVYLPQGIEGEALAAGSIRVSDDLSWEDWGTRVNLYLQEMDKLISPDLIIIGGGVSENFDRFKPYLTVKPDVVPARMGNDAGIVGAALAVLLPDREQI